MTRRTPLAATALALLLLLVPAADARPKPPRVPAAPPKPIAFDLTITARTEMSYSGKTKPTDKDCSHQDVVTQESGEETWEVKTPRPYRVTVDPLFGTMSFAGGERPMLRGRWTRRLQRASSWSGGACGGGGREVFKPAECGTRLPEQPAWLGFSRGDAVLYTDFPTNLAIDPWGRCQFFVYPEEFPHAPTIESIHDAFAVKRLHREKRIVVGARRTYPRQVHQGGMSLAVSGSAEWEAVLVRAG